MIQNSPFLCLHVPWSTQHLKAWTPSAIQLPPNSRFNKAEFLPLVQQPHSADRTGLTPLHRATTREGLSNLLKLRLKQIQDLKRLKCSSDFSYWFAKSITSENFTLLIN